MDLRATLARPIFAAGSLFFLCILTGCHLIHADPHVAFIGDSITEEWHYPLVNDGIAGNDTAHMLGRFRSLIPGHGYTAVVILGGTADVLTHIDPGTTIHNLELLAEEIEQQHAEPILCNIPPIFHSWDPTDHANYKPQVIDLNRRITQLAATHHWKLVDYYTPMAHRPRFLSDGVHMKRRGYLLMERALLRQLPAF
jgi:lysophospholipase L1-like esterase